MARRVVLVSDISGEQIPNGEAAVVTIRYQDGRRGHISLDVRADEVEDLARRGRKHARRGRPRGESSS